MKRFISLLTLVVLACIPQTFALAQTPQASNLDKDRGRSMLNAIKSDLKSKYYDPNFRGMDVDARFKAADEKIKTATSVGQIFGILAQALVDLEDSHTFFLPPGRSARTEYGYRMKMIGDKCFVTAVKPGSDAEAKGLKVGDEILAINNFPPSRDQFWKIAYFFNALRPQPGMQLAIKDPKGKESNLMVMAKVTTMKRVMNLSGDDDGSDIFELIRQEENAANAERHQFIDLGDAIIWRMPSFAFDPNEVETLVGRIRKHKTLILDMRGNPGGYVVTLQRLAGFFFDRDVKIFDLKGRKEMKPQIAKTRSGKVYNGNVIVLLDSASASAAELFARVVQLEKRGTVIGDRSAGAVMQSEQIPHHSGMDVVTFWGVSITNADVIMTDGKSLEKVGVAPDEVILPSAADVASGRDPVLTRAAELAGIKLDPEKAGKLFPYEWEK